MSSIFIVTCTVCPSLYEEHEGFNSAFKAANWHNRKVHKNKSYSKWKKKNAN